CAKEDATWADFDSC
nr:immunoglobulin heavy chain junction region [Macaca mulatta]